MELCKWLDITVIDGAICQDHVHMYLSVPPKHSPAFVMKMLKRKSAEYLRKEFPELGKSTGACISGYVGISSVPWASTAP